jgi:hypothetical protein
LYTAPLNHSAKLTMTRLEDLRWHHLGSSHLSSAIRVAYDVELGAMSEICSELPDKSDPNNKNASNNITMIAVLTTTLPIKYVRLLIVVIL